MRDGVTVHRAPICGAFVIDRDHLTAAEISDEVADLLTGGLPDSAAELPPELRDHIARGVAEGWLISEETS
jgi:hypothetical protein